VIGHESLAEIVQVGSAVERFEVGDLVVPSVRRPCPHPGCLACRSGHQDYCYTGEFTERGIKEAHGYMAEYVVDRERYMNVVPPDLREIAVLAEPLTIAEKALDQIFWMMQDRPPWLDPQTPSHERGRGLSALVLGIGPVGSADQRRAPSPASVCGSTKPTGPRFSTRSIPCRRRWPTRSFLSWA
jgi:glucose 1-dehydrogenase